MPAPSSIDQLPSELKAWLDQELKDRNFKGYSDLEAALNNKLEGHGFEISISRSALGRYGQKQKQAKERMLNAINMAQSLTEVGEDRADMLGQANTAMAQSMLLDLQIKAQELADTDPKELATKATLIRGLVHAASDIARASTNQKKWAAEAKRQARKEFEEEAAKNIDDAAQARGLTAEEAAFWREQVLGVQGG